MISDVQIRQNGPAQGAFFTMEENEQVAQMTFGKTDTELRIFHTEVVPTTKEKGLGKKLLEFMVTYARENNLKVIPLCPYVHAQFKKHPELYDDVWKKTLLS